jgi:hypothetical protein
MLPPPAQDEPIAVQPPTDALALDGLPTEARLPQVAHACRGRCVAAPDRLGYFPWRTWSPVAHQVEDGGELVPERHMVVGVEARAIEVCWR